MRLSTLKLLLPAIIPSWRFFDVIAPAPSIEYAILKTPGDTPIWQEFRPRPAHLSIPDLLKRMLYNPRWNESLFLVSCAERIMQNDSIHSIQEIRARIQNDLQIKDTYLQFRLVFRHRNGKVTAFTSMVFPS